MKLFDGSYRGVPFKVAGEYPRKVEKNFEEFDYAGSNFTEFDFLGKKSDTFPVRCFVAGKTVDSQREALERALDNNSSGKLVHPFFGNMQAVVTNYDVIPSTQHKGVIYFDIIFRRTSNIHKPSAKELLPMSIRSKADSLIDKTLSYFKDNFQPLVGVYDKSVAMFEAAGEAFNEAKKINTTVVSALNKVTSAVNNFVNGVTKLIFSPPELVASIGSVFTAFKGLGNNLKSKKKKWQNIANFSQYSNKNKPVTYNNVVANKNQDMLTDLMQVVAVSNAYADMAEEEFSNEIELQETKDFLEEIYQEISERGTLDYELMRELKDIRADFNRYTNEIDLTVKHLATVEINNDDSLLNLVHSFYGNLDNYEQIDALNQIDNSSFVSGEKKFLT